MKRLLSQLLIATIILLSTYNEASAQAFQVPCDGFSIKKTSYIHLKDGTIVEGQVRNVSRKKGLITKVEIAVGGDKGKKKAFLPDQIDHMYLPPTALDKFSKFNSSATDLTRADKVDIKKDILEKEFALYEYTEVMVKKKKINALLQVLNPEFDDKIKVYHNPFAGESASLGVGGVKVAGGGDKSFYVKKGKEVAYLMIKREYDENYEKLYGDCPPFLKKMGKELKWSKFEDHLFEYNKACSN